MIKSPLGDHGTSKRHARDADVAACLTFVRYASEDVSGVRRNANDDIGNACQTLSDLRNVFAHSGKQEMDFMVRCCNIVSGVATTRR